MSNKSNRDETLEALSDAQYVAPAAKTADLHSANHRNSFLYVFDYQTKFGDFPQVSKVLRKKIMFLAVFQITISINVMMQFCYFKNVLFLVQYLCDFDNLPIHSPTASRLYSW